MTDDKTNQGAADRSLVAGGEDYEVEHFARKHGMSTEQAREHFKRHDNYRTALERAVAEMKGSPKG